MNRKIFFICILVLAGLSVKPMFSQTFQRIGVINSSEILDEMPERIEASDSIKSLNQKYKAELQLMQSEYNKKYSDFISYQTSMAENIRLRRMQELFELEKHINEFMQTAQKDIDSKEKEYLDPLRAKLKDVIYQVGMERNLVCIYDLANPSIAFVTPDAIDLTPYVEQKLNIKKFK